MDRAIRTVLSRAAVFAALGALIIAISLSQLGWNAAAIALATTVVVLALVCVGSALSRRAATPRGLKLIASSPLFEHLAPTVHEQVAHKLEPISARAGSVVLTKGAFSDRFFIIESGKVEVIDDGAVLTIEGPGEVFGEIGLLSASPRTVTVRALTDITVLSLYRNDFLELVAHEDQVRSAATDIAAHRLTRWAGAQPS